MKLTLKYNPECIDHKDQNSAMFDIDPLPHDAEKNLEFLQAKSKIYFNFYREKIKTSNILKTFEFLVRTLRKTTIPITIALKKKTMTTPSPVARAG